MPSYAWCGVDPQHLPDVRELRAATPVDLPVIGDLFADPSGDSLPLVAAGAIDEPVVEVRHRRIRVLGAYWHSGWPHATSRSWLRASARDRLLAALDQLPEDFGFAIWDAWRDTSLQRALYEVAYQDPQLPPGFVNPPSADNAAPSPHSTGGTVDLTLTYKSRPLNLGTNFDDFLPQAHSDAFESATSAGDVLVRDLRRLLRYVLVSNGFVQLECEWWHFEYGTRLWAAITGHQPLFRAAARPKG